MGNPNTMVKCSSVNLKSRTNVDFNNVLINKWNLWNEFRDNFFQYNHLCFGRDSGFLAALRCSICVYFKEKRNNGQLLLLTLPSPFIKVVFEANQPSKGNKKM